MEHYRIQTLVGEILISLDGRKKEEAGERYLRRLWLPCEIRLFPVTHRQEAGEPREDALAQEVSEQLNAYLEGKLRRFTLPLPPSSGTPLQKKIQQALCRIPYGRTLAYKELGPPRTAARVCSQNSLPIFIPCHRVLPIGGSITRPGQYRGGATLKQFLLQLEASHA